VDGEVPAWDVAQLAQLLDEGVKLRQSWVRPGGIGARPARNQDTNPIDPTRHLRLAGQWAKKDGEEQEEHQAAPKRDHLHLASLTHSLPSNVMLSGREASNASPRSVEA